VWSAPGAAAGGGRAPWLHLSHEVGKYDELVQLEKYIKSRLEPHGIEVNLLPIHHVHFPHFNSGLKSFLAFKEINPRESIDEFGG